MSHTFIRREIRALESQGVRVLRYSLRAPHDLVDEADRSEAGLTRLVLDVARRIRIEAGKLRALPGGDPAPNPIVQTVGPTV